MNRTPSRRLPCAAFLLACLAVGPGAGVRGQQVILPPGFGPPAALGSRPSASYDLALAALAEGNVSRALDIALDEYQGSMRFGAQRWIDSIAASALVGECQFELGNLREALAAYEEAIALATVNSEWLLAVQFPPQPPQRSSRARVATWGRSGRGTAPARLPETVAIRQAGADPAKVLQEGGVLVAPFDQLIRPHEIMRSLVIAIYRQADLLGPLARETQAFDGISQALAQRPALPAHYAQSWIDVALGTVLWAQGKAGQATPLLTRGLVIVENLDHPLTAWGLIVLGRIALDADQPAQAVKYFEEATFAAADDGDARALEEAFRLAFAAHMAAGTRGVPPSIRGGCDWADRDLPVLHARLLAMQAEALLTAGDARGGAAALKKIDPRLLRGDAGRGGLGAEQAYADALLAYSSSDVRTGDGRLTQALALAQPRSLKLFQTARLVELFLGGSASLSDRQAEVLFAALLAAPGPREFALDPLGSLAIVTTDRQPAFEAWLAVAERRGPDAAFEAAEALVRDRWLAARPLGGRRIAVERLLAADPATLPAADMARRTTILGTRPQLAAAVDRMTQLRATLSAAMLAAAPAAGGGPAKLPGDEADWTAYRGFAATRAAFNAALAAGREPLPIDFPPLTPAGEIRSRLRPRQLILSFRWTQRGLKAVLESRDRFTVWDVRQAAGLPAEIAQLAKGLCLFDPDAPVATDKLLASPWRDSMAQLERMLFENSKVTFAEGIDELVVVPDGWLWYLPFELLPVASAAGTGAAGPDAKLLRDVCRIRYAPTRSLAVASFSPTPFAGPIGVHAGKMARSTKAQAGELTERVTAAVERAVPLPIVAGDPSVALTCSTFDALALFVETGGSGPAAAWPLVPSAGGSGAARGGMTLGDWLAPPLKRPAIVLLPGMQTALAHGLQKQSLPSRPGDDLFLPAVDLLAAGARTAVLARWRVGGRMSADLVAEFLRDATTAAVDAAPPAAAESWHRAVDIVTGEAPDPGFEPRLKPNRDAVLVDGRHPFLWAGYLLVDCGAGRHPAPPEPESQEK